ncbi:MULTISPECIES: YbhB/YbcL family Raf kinase inhibitor-like protein [unclassified Rhizobacter]|uniref:YbhB/YbcL family Raf kinase inhibitor-like protein n=1 Tax=unclassified Rhizobacter TaxID=2640088 RepID=UPI0006FDBB04|nr:MULTISPECIES: YbhB/YbcL family Raf kinase inhibitor-like protein [unclassified Rhizobacter]KQU78622.1 phospholipid-binding protein [Rhizobacter sp. Root29]KQW11087.1 phospholipid-binding protein [Rhizobacter sp. Root1238]KRB25490.1 phospholipid-binding protein [Rhizobacter sp. Root16D2]
MKLWSDSWINGDRIPARHAAGRLDGSAGVGFSDNLNPHLAWSEVPPGTQSLALICHDFDVPSRGDDVNQADREVPSDLPRVDFFHWVMVDLPADLSAIAEGEFSRGFTPRGKPGPQTLHGARHGLNDYTGWFAGDAEKAGQYFGYDGPFPPFNDSLVHHYVFTLYALDIARAPVDGAFTGAQVRAAIARHVLAEATHSGTYTLNRRLA